MPDGRYENPRDGRLIAALMEILAVSYLPVHTLEEAVGRARRLGSGRHRLDSDGSDGPALVGQELAVLLLRPTREAPER